MEEAFFFKETWFVIDLHRNLLVALGLPSLTLLQATAHTIYPNQASKGKNSFYLHGKKYAIATCENFMPLAVELKK